MSHRGRLLTMTAPLAAMEEEFNAWYDDDQPGWFMRLYRAYGA